MLNRKNPGNRGLLLVISGPSGVGKGTVCRHFSQDFPSARSSVSVTTRAQRPGEVEGKDYFFRTREEFQRLIEKDAFLEYMEVFGSNFYGTPAGYVDESLERGYDIILEIDVQGAQRVKAKRPEAVMVFIAPPSLEALEARLRARNTESEQDLNKRLDTARKELESIGFYDYIIVNHERAVRDAADMLRCVVLAEKCRIMRNAEIIQNFMR